MDAQVRGVTGGQDGVVVRCELDGTGVQIAADYNLSDPRVSLLSFFLCLRGKTITGCGNMHVIHQSTLLIIIKVD